MDYPLDLAGFAPGSIELRSTRGGYALFQNGQKADRPPKRNRSYFSLVKADGTNEEAQLKPRALGMDIPNVKVGGELYQPVEALPKVLIVLSLIPLVLLFFGGALGGLIGAVASVGNMRLLRKVEGPLRYILPVVVLIAAVAIFLVVASLINNAVDA